jgi:cobalt/nickel transport system ATP-binding protein
LRDVSVRYGEDEPVLQDVSLSIAAGERVALVGLNGSGKTTLLMAAVGLATHAGEIEVCGIRLERRTLAEVRGRVGVLFNVPEDQLLFPRVIDDVAFGLVRRGLARDEAARRAGRSLASLGVGGLGESSLHRLSHGQKQRVALAGALVAEPPLLLLDEPSAGLDPPGKRRLARLLGSLEAAMLIATHDLEFARGLCNRFVLLEGGRVAVDDADPDAVVRRWEARDSGGGAP